MWKKIRIINKIINLWSFLVYMFITIIIIFLPLLLVTFAWEIKTVIIHLFVYFLELKNYRVEHYIIVFKENNVSNVLFCTGTLCSRNEYLSLLTRRRIIRLEVPTLTNI